MSVVTNCILCLDIQNTSFAYGDEEDPGLAAVNRFFTDGRGFVCVDDKGLPRGWYGGTKMMEANIYLGAFNYLDLAGLIAHIKSLPWKVPTGNQLFVMEQDDAIFTERLK